MSDDFETDAHDYLLHQMDAARRAAFDAELARSPEARARLKEIADAVAGFACVGSEPEALRADDHARVLGALREIAREAERAGAPAVAWWRRALWPLAAAILLALNLLDFDRPIAPGGSPRARPRVDETVATKSGAAAPEAKSPDAVADGPRVPNAPAPNPAAANTPTTVALAQQAAELRENVTELQRANDRLRAEYDLLVRRHAEQSVSDRELNRLSTMELVDPAGYARGERKGLVSVARGILAEPGVVIASEPPPPISGSTAAVPRLPYAWSVFDEQEHRGFLNLYQLPALPVEQALHVWVRAPDAQEFLRVGEVPTSFNGGNGSLHYSLPPTARAPAELLITIESRNTTPTVPSGPIVLRGP